MNANLKKMLALAVVIGFSIATTAMAGESYLNAGSKARGQFGATSRAQVGSGMVYRSAPPVVARSQPAPSDIAQAPTEQRFSYEPAKPADSGQPTVRTYRRFSYEPGSGSVRTSRSRSSQPAWELPKTSARKYGSF